MTAAAALTRLASIGRRDAAPTAVRGARLLGAADAAGLAPSEARFERVSREELLARSEPMVALLEDGGAVAIVTRDGARRAAGAGGAEEPAGDAAALERYTGWALVSLAAGEEIARRRAENFAATLSSEAGAADAWRVGPKMLRATIAAAPKGAMPALVIAAILINVAGFAIPLYTMSIYDRVIPHDAASTLIALTTGIAILLAVELGLRLARSRLTETLGAELSVALSAAALAKLSRLRLRDAPRKPATLVSALGALESLAAAAPSLVLTLAVDLPFSMLMLAYVCYLGGALVLAPIVALLAIAAINLAGHRAAARANKAAIGASNLRHGLVEEMLNASEAVKLRGSLGQLDRLWRRLTEDCAEKALGVREAASRTAQYTVTASNLATIGVVALGAVLVQLDALTVGGLVACSILSSRAVGPVSQAVLGVLRFAQLADATKPALALFDAQQEAAGDAAAADTAPKPGLAFKHVVFAYPGSSDAALADVTLRIEPGERVGFLGRIGSGKSTLLRLAAQLYEPTAGVVELGERNIASYDPSFLRRFVSLSPQEPQLFDDSIYENLVFGLDIIDPDRFQQATRVSGLFDLVKRKPEGFSFRVGPDGRRLSSGERRTIALARSLMQDFSILALDEPTAAFDAKLEADFIAGLEPMIGDATFLVTTHRTPALSLVNRVVVMEAGRIIADGPRDEILARLRGRMSA